MHDNKNFEKRMWPVQGNKYFDGSDNVFIEKLYEIVSTVSNLTHPEEEFKLEFTPMWQWQEMASNPIHLHFFNFLLRLQRSCTVLEIGTFIGISALNFAKTLPSNGKVVTIEKFDHFAEIARKNFKNNGYENKIELINGDAFEILEKMDPTRVFDFIFLDGNKERYDEYICALDKRLAPKGIIVVDNVIFAGDVINDVSSMKTEKALGVKRMLDIVETWDNYYKMLLPFSDGVLLLMKND